MSRLMMPPMGRLLRGGEALAEVEAPVAEDEAPTNYEIGVHAIVDQLRTRLEDDPAVILFETLSEHMRQHLSDVMRRGFGVQGMNICGTL